jgi:branched-chain amino acid transport system permease protein
MAGFWFANNSEFVSPAILDWRGSGHLLVMVILGSLGPFGRGIGARLVGAAAGAAGLIAAEEGLALLTPRWPLVLGLVLLMAALAGRR